MHQFRRGKHHSRETKLEDPEKEVQNNIRHYGGYRTFMAQGTHLPHVHRQQGVADSTACNSNTVPVFASDIFRALANLIPSFVCTRQLWYRSNHPNCSGTHVCRLQAVLYIVCKQNVKLCWFTQVACSSIRLYMSILHIELTKQKVALASHSIKAQVHLLDRNKIIKLLLQGTKNSICNQQSCL